MPRPTKRSAKKARTPKPAASEPEVLGDDTHDGEREPLLDALHDLLCGADGFELPARLAIQEAFAGKCDTARELEVLKMVKGDARFRIVEGSGGKPNRIGLAQLNAQDDAAATEALLDIAKGMAGSTVPGALVVTGPIGIPPAEPQQTLGDLVADAQGRPLVVPWPHDTGSHVLLLTEGYPPVKATIKNIHRSGSSAFYDLTTANGGETNDVPAHRIGRDLDAEGELEAMRLENGALRRHIAKGATLAQQIVVKEAEERTKADELSKLRKAIDELHAKLAEVNRCDPGQTDLRDVVGDGETRGEKMASEPSDDEDVLADGPLDAPAPRTERSLADVGISLDTLTDARLDRSTASTGKPAKVRPFESGTGHRYVVTDVQDGVAVALPVVDNEDWRDFYSDEFGHVLELPSDAQTVALAKGGTLCGCPVKVGRATRWIGPERDALLVRLPVEDGGNVESASEDVERASAVSGKDAAAGA